MTELSSPLLSFPREALPRFLKALEARTKPASGPYPFIPDESLRYSATKDGFTLKINTAAQTRSYTGRAQFVEEGDRLCINLKLEPEFSQQALRVLMGLGLACLFVFAWATGAPLEFLLMFVPVGAIFFLIHRTISSQALRDATAHMMSCLLECVLETERANSTPPPPPSVPTPPTP